MLNNAMLPVWPALSLLRKSFNELKLEGELDDAVKKREEELETRPGSVGTSPSALSRRSSCLILHEVALG